MVHHSPQEPRADGPPVARARDGDMVFEVRITGVVSDEVLDELAHVEVTNRELRTSLRGRFQDQSELHGFLARLRAFGLEVVEVRRLATGDPDLPDAAGS
jgi:hypothetical protein